MGKPELAEPTEALRRGTERRLEFIEFRLYWSGRLNRADLTRQFGISVPQASLDLTRYQQLAPANMTYDKSAKTYLASPDLRPVFFSPDADAYLNSLRSISDNIVSVDQTWVSRTPDIAALPMLTRRTNPDHLRAILAAIQDKTALNVRYQSMSRPQPTWRGISPHALGFDGLRWHVRAFCHIDTVYKDFLSSRILEVGEKGPSAADASGDSVWHEMVTMLITPHPELSPAQRRAIEIDYGMTDGILKIEVRAALAYYARKRLGLDRASATVRPNDQQIVLANAEEVQTLLMRLGHD